MESGFLGFLSKNYPAEKHLKPRTVILPRNNTHPGSKGLGARV